MAVCADKRVVDVVVTTYLARVLRSLAFLDSSPCPWCRQIGVDHGENQGITPQECIVDVVTSLHERRLESDVRMTEHYETTCLWMQEIFEVN